MTDVEDRAKATEVEDGTIAGRATNETSSQPDPKHEVKEENDGIKTEKTIVLAEKSVEKNTEIDGDSEAETLIESPEKKRNIVDGAPVLKPSVGEVTSKNGQSAAGRINSGETPSRKRKRSIADGQEPHASPTPSRRSSPLSSPVAQIASGESDSDHQARRRELKIERTRNKRNGERDRSQGSEGRGGVHGLRQRRPSDIAPFKKDKQGLEASERRETRSATYPRQSDNERSPSPQPIPRRDHHRRGASTQLTTNEFGGRKRGRPPLINTRRNRSADRATSVSSDDSNSPAPPRSAAHKLAGHDNDTMSPAKTGPRKWRDKNGRTFLARACNNNDLESARARLAERREDLNWADNAGNTPLQIAALEGFVDIVKFLLEANCDVDTRNIDRETPLIDAVENGHVEVVKLLLDHGANPRLGNAKGDEPYELVPQDDENYEEIRALLADAKEREGKKHKAHEQIEAANREGGSSRAASAASPRDSPPIGPRSPPAFASRRRTGRSESTRNDLLWQANTQENLTKLAGKGDVQGVASILNILQKAETESLIAAAKAGHEEVLQYLLGMGDPNPDPDPVRNLKPGYNTPMLAAIGRGHVDVVKLLVSQSGFNPTKKYKDRTYYELSRERKGEDWQHEHEILKSAYDNYGSSKGRKTTSPRKTRDGDKLKPRPVRRSTSPISQKRLSSSPTVTHKSLPTTKSSESSPRDRRKLLDSERRKVSAGKLDGGDSSVAVASDMDSTVSTSKKGHRVRRSQSDLPIPGKIEPEPSHRRRRLVTGKEHRRNKSNTANSGSEEDSKEVIVVKQEDRHTPTLKRGRSRSSNTPDPKVSEEADKARLGTKKRRTVLESSPDEVRNAPKMAQPDAKLEKLPSVTGIGEKSIEESVPSRTSSDGTSVPTVESESTAASVEVPVETNPIPLHNVVDPEILPDADQGNLEKKEEAEPKLQTAVDQTEAVNKEAQAAEERRLEILAKEQAEQEAKAEAERIAKLEAEAAAAAAAAAKAEAEAEAERQAEAARKAAEEEARKIAEQKAAEEAELKRKAEEEALLRQLKEEEERQERLRQEKEERRRLQLLEEERRRREALPIVLNKCAAMIDDHDPSLRNPAWLTKFLPLFTVKTRQLESNLSSSDADDRWVANFQVACLLATKDLDLRNFSSLEKRACTAHERQCLWRVARNMLSFEYDANGINTSVKQAAQREDENRPKFFAMEELFWVKLTNFTDEVTRQPHLAQLSIRLQPISLASYTSLAQQSPLPLTNGASPAAPKLTNGVHNYSSRPGNGIEQATV